MYFNSHTYRRADIKYEPHNLYTDFSKDYLFDKENISSENVNIGIPYPVGDNVVSGYKDPVSEMNAQAKEFKQKLKKGHSKFSPKDLEETSYESTQYVTMPKGLLEWYNTCKDPETDWSDDANMYFNGVLDFIILHEKQYFIFYSFSNNTLNLMEPESHKITFVDYKLTSPIYSIQFYNLNEPLLLLRQKNCIQLVSIIDIENFKLIYELNIKMPIVDAKINKENGKHIGLIKNNKLTVITFKTNKTKFTYKNKDPKKYFLELEFIKNYVVLMEKYVVYILNYKTGKLINEIHIDLITCNPLKTMKYMMNVLFLVSQHYVIKIDLDNPENISFFSHTLEKPPILMDIMETDNNVYMCLGNPFLEDKILFAGRMLYSIPYKMPGISKTLHEACIRKPDLLLIDKLKDVLSSAITGIKIVNINNTVYVYYITATGCMFRQEISFTGCSIAESCEMLYEWIDKQGNIEEKSLLHITNFAELSSMFFFLNKPMGKNKPESDNTENKSSNDLVNKLNTIYRKENLQSTFAKGFLDVWEDCEETEGLHDSSVEIPFFEKVNTWMDTFDMSLEENL